MRPQFKILVITGAMLTAGLGAAVPAAAATAAPVMDTSVFACSGAHAVTYRRLCAACSVTTSCGLARAEQLYLYR